MCELVGAFSICALGSKLYSLGSWTRSSSAVLSLALLERQRVGLELSSEHQVRPRQERFRQNYIM